MKRLGLFTLALLLTVGIAGTASSQGLLLVPRPESEIFDPLATKTLKVTFEATESLAKTRVEQTFHNPTNRTLQGRLLFPLPRGSAVSNFAMWAGNKRLQARVLPKNEAKRIYDDIVRRMQDPALLQYVGHGMFEANVFPIEPKSDKKIELEYSCVLEAEGDVIEYDFPLTSSLVTRLPVMSFVIAGSIKSSDPLKNVYCPTHPIALHREGENEARLSFETNDLKADKDFKVYYTLSRDDVGISVLSHKEGDEGYFLLMAAPKYATDAKRVPPKEVVFVMDVSGSMQGNKLEQARKAAKHIVDNLGADDYFNLVTFSDHVQMFQQEQVKATRNQVQRALEFIDRLEAAGGTDINASLGTAVKMFKHSNIARMIIFLTDGQPTVGVTDTNLIIKNIEEANRQHVRVYGFGVGHDVGAELLDGIAKESRGTVTYVLKDEDLERAISSFYNKVAYPVLSDLSLEVSGVTASEMYPRVLPDLFKGTQLVLYGRYTGGGSGKVKLSGKVEGHRKSFDKLVKFAREPGEFEFIPRLWALRRVGFLLEQIREKGEEKELVDECVRLGTKYAIVTPYTSHLVTADDESVVQRPDWWRELRDSIEGQRRRPYQPATTLDKDAYAKKMASPSLKAGGAPEEEITTSMAIQELAGATAEKSQYTGQRKVIGTKTFLFKDECWVDTAIDKSRLEKPDIVIKFFSDEYFEMIGKDEKLAKYLSVGKCVMVLHDGKVLKVESPEK